MKRPFFAPETLQISMMDCGVASLITFVTGYGVLASYERLRDACQTSVDGTSIDALEDVANDLGVRACQHLLPRDAFMDALDRRLPAIVVLDSVGQPPHFVVVWRRLGPWLQVMDPQGGRMWMRTDKLARELYTAEIWFQEDELLEWFLDSSYREVLVGLAARVLGQTLADEVRRSLSAPESSRELAAIEAALRLTARIDERRRRSVTWRDAFFLRIHRIALSRPDAIPEPLRGFVVHDDGSIRVRSALALAPETIDHPFVRETGAPPPSPAGAPLTGAAPPVEHDGRDRLWAKLAGLLGRDARTLAVASGAALVAMAIATATEVLLYRAAWDAPRTFGTFGQRASAVVIVAALLVVTLVLEAAILWASRAIGRYLEGRLRLLTFALLPQVEDDFVRSRPTTDLAYRAHSLTLGREFPASVVRLVRSGLDLAVSVVALTILDAANLAAATIGIVALAGAAVYARATLRSVDGRFQAHGARLLSVFMDALRGFRPLRLHGYQNAIRAEQDRELSLWQATGRAQVAMRALLGAFDAALGVFILLAFFLLHVERSGDARIFVIMAFWAFRIPMTTRDLLLTIEDYPAQRSAFARLLELTSYAQETTARPANEARAGLQDHRPREGVPIVFDDVSVVAGGHEILSDVQLAIPAAQHVAIVGPSGAGKSSLAGVLLGLSRPSKGRVLVEGEPLGRERLERLREETAWVDPAAQLWNRSLYDNLEYAARGFRRRDLLETMETCDLLSVLEGMDQGLGTPVGSDGRLISGGEGQRLRLGRALLRADARFVVLDEPFRGLDRATRRTLALRARRAWKDATLLFISHDIERALDFDRVLVVDGGRIVEDGHPVELAKTSSKFATMLDAERRLLRETWSPAHWQRLRVEDGQLKEVSA